MTGRLITFGLALVLATGSALAGTLEHIRRSGELEVCANANALPYSARDGELPGFQVEIAQRLAEALGVELRLSWVRLRWQAKFTGCDAFVGVAVLGEGEPGIIRLTRPFTAVSMVLVTPAAAPPVTNLTDLTGRTVAVPSGSLPYYRLREHGIATVERFFDEQQILETLLTHEADAAVVSHIGLGWFAHRHPELELRSVPSDFIDPHSGYDYAVALRKADAATVAGFEEILQRLRNDGSLEAIFRRYGVTYQPPHLP